MRAIATGVSSDSSRGATSGRANSLRRALVVAEVALAVVLSAVAITGLASDQSLVQKLRFQGTTYEGPTGIVGVLHDACNRAGVPSASLWAAVPAYVPGAPSPKAALALIEQSVPRGRLTESMAVLHTGLAAGIAPGATLTGVVVDASGAARGRRRTARPTRLPDRWRGALASRTSPGRSSCATRCPK